MQPKNSAFRHVKHVFGQNKPFTECHPKTTNINAKKQNYFETYRYLALGLINATNETWFKDIFQVKPSTYIEFSRKGLKNINYYKLEDQIDEEKDKNAKSFFYYKSSISKKIS